MSAAPHLRSLCCVWLFVACAAPLSAPTTSPAPTGQSQPGDPVFVPDSQPSPRLLVSAPAAAGDAPPTPNAARVETPVPPAKPVTTPTEPATTPVNASPTGQNGPNPSYFSNQLPGVGRVFDAYVGGGWATVIVPTDDSKAWHDFQTALSAIGHDEVWRGSRIVPTEVQNLGPMTFVSPAGVVEVDLFGKVTLHEMGWAVDYKAPKLKHPAIAVIGVPAADAKMRPGGKVKPIARSHPLAQRLCELDNDPELPKPSRRRGFRYTAQVTEGRFPGASRIVVVNGYDDSDAYRGDYAATFTLNEHDGVQQQLPYFNEVVGLVDLDGDGYDEVLTSSTGYEYNATALYRLSDDGIQAIELTEHNE